MTRDFERNVALQDRVVGTINDGMVTFASPNGLSAFNRMGFAGELEGESLAEAVETLKTVPEERYAEAECVL